MKKIIIGIHGLGNKPPKNLLSTWWNESIEEGLTKENHLHAQIDFELVYWADIFNKMPLLPEAEGGSDALFDKEKYYPESSTVLQEPSGLRKKAADFLEKYYEKFVVDSIVSMEYPALTELMIHYNMKELEAYYSNEDFYYQGEKRLIKDVMIERLASVLEKNKSKQIMLIAHSMGSLIAYDTLLRYEGKVCIDTCMTIGSPLGHKYVVQKTLASREGSGGLRVPENIETRWYNLNDRDDKIALVPQLAALYKPNAKGVSVKDSFVKNMYAVSGMKNPHKSYGYLRTPEVAAAIKDFFTVKEKKPAFSFFKKFFT